MEANETYAEFRERMQVMDPDPTRCRHAMPLRTRCIACEDDERREDAFEGLDVPFTDESNGKG